MNRVLSPEVKLVRAEEVQHMAVRPQLDLYSEKEVEIEMKIGSMMTN